MIDINEILGLDKKAFDINYNDYQNWKCITPLQAKEAIKEIVQETLRMAAEDARINFHDGQFKEDKPLTYFQLGVNNLQIDKDSITNVINKINF